MSEAVERAKSRTLKEIGPIISAAFMVNTTTRYNYLAWKKESLIKAYSAGDSSKAEEVEKFIEWCLEDRVRLQVFIATRSPSTAAALSLQYATRLCPEAEKIVTEKAKDRPKLLEYCGRWGIILGDMSKVTMKAAFSEDATREKAYIKKLEHTKRKIKEFLEQMVSNGMMDSGTTVKELIEIL